MRHVLRFSLGVVLAVIFASLVAITEQSCLKSKLLGDTTDQMPDSTADLMMKPQRTYWTYNSAEKAALLNRYPDSLSWPETLRLHHLSCLELLNSQEGKAQLMTEQGESFEAPEGVTSDLCRELTRRLLSENSPYRMRHCSIWQGEAGKSEQRPAGLQGFLRDASLTHLGCLEVIRLDSQFEPKELAFIPFDDIQGVMFAQPGLFRPAKVLYEYSKGEEIVCVPLIYAISWLSEFEYDHDGTFTRFCCHLFIEKLNYVGIGIGHHDFSLTVPEGENEEYLFGLGSVSEMAFNLELIDPKFDQKCRGRGLDPLTIRKQLAGK
jgi:hypothetical protein